MAPTPARDTPSLWSDLPAASVRIGEGRVTTAVTVVFTDAPQVAWTVECRMVSGRPRVVRLTMQATGPDALLDEQTPQRPPYRRLAAFWARATGEGASNSDHDLMSLLIEAKPIRLDRKPDPRPFGGAASEAYRDAVREWSAPIADEMRSAAAAMLPVGDWIAARFGVRATRAEELMRAAREAHDLPYLRAPKPLE